MDTATVPHGDGTPWNGSAPRNHEQCLEDCSEQRNSPHQTGSLPGQALLDKALRQELLRTVLKAQDPALAEVNAFNELILRKIPWYTEDNAPPVRFWINRPPSEAEPEGKHRCMVFRLANVRVEPPVEMDSTRSTTRITAQQCQLRSLIYASPLVCDAYLEEIRWVPGLLPNGKRKCHTTVVQEAKGVTFGHMPVIVGGANTAASEQAKCKDLCMQGLFVINGLPKVVIKQERMGMNRVHIQRMRGTNKYSYMAEVRSRHHVKEFNQATAIVRLLLSRPTHPWPDMQGTHVMLEIPYIGLAKHIGVIFSLYGCTTHSALVAEFKRAMCLPEHADLPVAVRSFLLGVELIEKDAAFQQVVDHLMAKRRQAMQFYKDNGRGSVALSRGNIDENVVPAKIIKKAHHIVNVEILTHVRTCEGKCQLLANIVAQMIMFGDPSRTLKEDDRDNYINKRVEDGGGVIFNVYIYLLKLLLRDIRIRLQTILLHDKPFHLGMMIEQNVKIYHGMKTVFNTGMWIGANGSQKTGVLQVVSMLTLMSYMSHLTRVNTPVQHKQKHVEPRKLHASHWGMVCASETPEGAGCGLVHNLAVSALLAWESPDTPVREYVARYLAHEARMRDEDPSPTKRARLRDGQRSSCHSQPHVRSRPNDGEPAQRSKPTRRYVPCWDQESGGAPESANVIVNGDWLGRTDDVQHLYVHLVNLRRRQYFSPMMTFEKGRMRQLIINTDAGRICRPLFIVEDGVASVVRKEAEVRAAMARHKDDPEAVRLWLLRNRIIEYLDTAESAMNMIAMTCNDVTAEHTHVEIHPSVIKGISTNSIPHYEHNQSPRNTYFSAMNKHAIGTTHYLNMASVETVQHKLNYPQRPLVSTVASDVYGMDELASGVNVILLVGTHNGFNQEDSLIVNKAAIERGLFRTTCTRNYRSVEEKQGLNLHSETFEVPDPEQCSNIVVSSEIVANDGDSQVLRKNFSGLDVDGIVRPHTRVQSQQPIIGKTLQLPMNGTRIEKKDFSTCVRPGEQGSVSRCVLTVNGDNLRQINVSVTDTRIPIIGDKFTSRHGQKGTIGAICPQEDLPFSMMTGMSPDMIVNPHCVITRMTIGQLAEILGAKRSVIDGMMQDGTAFEEVNMDNIEDALHKAGFQRHGEERFIDGMSGEMMNMTMFMGVCYMHRLKHLVADKIHSRAGSGHVHRITHQPVEGRVRGGGFRVGEMERDAITAWGASGTMRERMRDASDPCTIHICRRCGVLAYKIHRLETLMCNVCCKPDQVREVKTTRCFMIFLQELYSMGIFPRLSVSPNGCLLANAPDG